MRATEALTAELYGRDEFLQQVSQDPQVAFVLLRRLSERLNAIDERFAGLRAEQLHQAQVASLAARSVTAYKPLGDERPTAGLVLKPGSKVLAASLTTQRVMLDRLPYVVGRKPGPGEAEPAVTVDLILDEAPPYRLSCPHFWIEARPEGYGIRDLGSRLGTQVNGMAIGSDFFTDDGPLNPGENEVVAGGEGSGYRFKIMVE